MFSSPHFLFIEKQPNIRLYGQPTTTWHFVTDYGPSVKRPNQVRTLGCIGLIFC